MSRAALLRSSHRLWSLPWSNPSSSILSRHQHYAKNHIQSQTNCYATLLTRFTQQPPGNPAPSLAPSSIHSTNQATWIRALASKAKVKVKVKSKYRDKQMEKDKARDRDQKRKALTAAKDAKNAPLPSGDTTSPDEHKPSSAIRSSLMSYEPTKEEMDLAKEAVGWVEQRVRVPRGSRGNHHKQGRRWKDKIKNNKRKRVKFDKTLLYSLHDALYIMRKASFVKYVESIDMVIHTSSNPVYADQNLRGMMVLPHGSGRSPRIAVFCSETDSNSITQAKQAGADRIGGMDLIKEVKEDKIDFEFAISTPEFMPKMAQIGRILGPKKLMPNVRLGTVTKDIGDAVSSVKRGSKEFRVDKQGNVHLLIGKMNFTDQQVCENILAAFDTILVAKPTSIKKGFIKKVAVSSSMGPGIMLNPELLEAKLINNPKGDVYSPEKVKVMEEEVLKIRAEKRAARAARMATNEGETGIGRVMPKLSSESQPS